MKKHLLSLFALASMVFASSCSQEEIISQSTGNEVKVTFTTELRNDAKSRTVGEDTDNIDKLIFAVYDESGKNLPLLGQTLGENDLKPHPDDPNKKIATIEVVLVKGQTYSFAFWAQNAAYSAYTFNENNAEITVDYNQSANKREADAFFKGITNHKVTGTFTMDVTLKRPFAQVNFLTSQEDIINARKAGFYVKESSIKVKNVAKTLNVLTGEVSNFENIEVTFDYADLLLDNQAIESTTINGVAGDWKYLATAYFLPQDKSGETKINATMKIKAEDTQKATTEIVATDITAQRNYRTNIYGNLLTSNGTFNVVVDPDFEDDDHNVSTDEFTETYTSVNDALEANKDKTDALTYNVQATQEQSSVAIEIPSDTKASSLTFNLDNLADGATISISNATGGAYANPVVIEVPEGANLGNVTVDLPNAHVTLKQGSYETVISTTSATTLEVGNGTIIETLTVNQGNVRIAEGGEVGTITNSTNGTLYVLVGGEWTNMANKDAKTIVIYEDTKHTYALNNMYSTDKLEDLISYARNVLVLSDITISLTKDATGDVTIVQEPGVTITILGNNKDFNGVITVDGKSATYITAGLTIKDLNFVAESISADACIRLGDGTNATRYTCNVTVDNCTFDVSGAVGVKSYTGGDKNLTITGCTATAQTHSLVQAKGIDGILVEKCTVNSVRGLNFNNSTNVTIDNCTIDVKKYAVRYGEGDKASGTAAEKYSIKNSTLKSANEEGDAVIVLRGTANNATLTIENTKIEGELQITNNAENAIIIIDGVATVNSADGLTSMIANGYTTVNLAAGNYTMPEPDLRAKTLTIIGSKDAVIDVSAVDARDQFVTGATLKFEGVTLNFGKVNYMGFANTASLTYKDCQINGLQFLFGENVTFENCELNSNGAEHCVWTYGAKNVSFKECDFTYGDRGINCYSDNDVEGGKQTVNFAECTFITDNTASKGAVEINSYFFSKGIEVNLTGCTAPGYGDLVYISEWDSTSGEKTVVNKDGSIFNAPIHTKN